MTDKGNGNILFKKIIILLREIELVYIEVHGASASFAESGF